MDLLKFVFPTLWSDPKLLTWRKNNFFTNHETVWIFEYTIQFKKKKSQTIK